jgi:DNA-binding transcriptional MerR regulator
MPDPNDDLTLAELAEQAGVSERTIRYYIQFGVLPAPQGAGPKTRYRRSHLGRLRFIRLLQERHLPLNAIGKLLSQHSEKEIEGFAEESQPASRSSALSYVQALLAPDRGGQDRLLHESFEKLRLGGLESEARSHWERIRISSDIELHVRRPLSKPDNRRLEELLKRIRELFPKGRDQ